MSITQIRVIVPHAPGTLNEICEILEKDEINIKAIMASSVVLPVHVNLVVNKPEVAASLLAENGFQVSTKEVLAVAVPDHPGGLNSVLRPLREAGINIETIYPFINLRGDEAIIIIDVDKIKEAKELLKKQWIKIYGKEIYKI